jgi:hypothetical protein
MSSSLRSKGDPPTETGDADEVLNYVNAMNYDRGLKMTAIAAGPAVLLKGSRRGLE